MVCTRAEPWSPPYKNLLALIFVTKRQRMSVLYIYRSLNNTFYFARDTTHAAKCQSPICSIVTRRAPNIVVMHCFVNLVWHLLLIVELHPYLPQPELLKFSASKGENDFAIFFSNNCKQFINARGLYHLLVRLADQLLSGFDRLQNRRL